MSRSVLRVAFLVGGDSDATRLCIARVAAIPGVEVAAILLDTARPRLRLRIRNLKRNIRREGWRYPFIRVADALADALENVARNFAPPDEVDALLRRAFPDRDFSLDDLANRHGIPLVAAGNLNGAAAREALAAVGCDLGVVVGTRILKRATFGMPRLGSINIHQGKVPEYRGLPPGFWELYEAAASAGITIHQVDDGLDTGAVIAERSIPIHPRETLASLQHKLNVDGAALLAEAVADIASGSVSPSTQPAYTKPARSWPTRAQQFELARRTGDITAVDTAQRLTKALWHLLLYYSGFVPLRRHLRRRSRGAILLYHRVNDTSVDVLTTSCRRFAEHLVFLRRYYGVRTSAWMVDRVIAGQHIPPTSVVIHFDDCYADVYDSAAPLLRAAGITATSFVSSGFVGTTEVFAHDTDSPHRFDNMTAAQVAALPFFGVDVGSHTVSHPDMGGVPLDEAREELRASKQRLERITHRPVDSFAFPFGRPRHCPADVAALAGEAGYRAIYAASGGFIGTATSAANIPRIGVCDGSLAQYLLFELEGLSLAALRERLGRAVSPWRLHDRKPDRPAPTAAHAPGLRAD